MEILNLESNSIPLSTSYVGDADIKFISVLDKTEEGLTFFKEAYLHNASDRKINNYSSIYLTDKQKFSDILNIQSLPQVVENLIFNTSLVDNETGLYVTLSSLSSQMYARYYFTEKNEKFVDNSDRIFEITLINNFEAKILHRSKNRQYYYLIYDTNDNNLKFSLTSTDTNSKFKYILDKENNKLALFKEFPNGLSAFRTYNNTIGLTSILSSFIQNHFNVNYYIQKLNPKLNTSWVSYVPFHKNAYEINPERSRSNLKNNYIISSQYSYITGNEIQANILTLKNQTSHKNYSYRSDYIEKLDADVPAVDNRTYTGLFTGNEQEKGDYSITLNYEFYNADYRFNADSYTVFVTPQSLYPYTQININDLRWDKMGAIAGENPYMSDKIFQKKIAANDVGAEYLCSWLFKNKYGELIWLDRYYYPLKTSYATALSTSFNYAYVDPNIQLFAEKLQPQEYYDVPFVYNTLQEELKETPQSIRSAVYGRSFYDKRSDLTILPNSEYIYYRVGNNYVKQIVETLRDALIQDGLVIKNSNDAEIYLEIVDVDEQEYGLDNNTYATIEKYNGINEYHQFTISFWMKSNDWSKKNGYQILGNLNDKGFAVLDDRKITPFIMIQHKNKIHLYNTNFQNVGIASLDSENNIQNTKIKDIHRTDHLDSFYTINIS